MSNIFLASAEGAIAGSGALMILASICFGLACLLFPFVVMSRLAGIMRRLDKLRSEQEAIGAQQFQELQRQNQLTRQLLRAYGHEPEA